MVLTDFLDELVLGPGFGEVVYLPALGAESVDGILANVFQKEQTKVLVVNGVEDFWDADAR